MTGELSVGWLLVGDSSIASARLQGWIIHRELRRLGVRSAVLNAPGAFDTRLRWKAPRRWLEALWRRRDILIFQKIESSRAVRLARLARQMGTRVVFLQADVRESPLYRLADRVVASSRELARLLKPICPAPITVIEDPLDIPRDIMVATSSRRERLKVLWIGSKGNFPAIEGIAGILASAEFADLELVTVSDHPEASFPWSQQTAVQQILAADLGVIPCLDTVPARAKSSNRLSLLMAAGLPVVATPIPSYQEVVTHSKNGFLAQDAGEWVAALRALRDPTVRNAVGRAARATAWGRFDPKLIVQRWELLFRELSGRSPLNVGVGSE